MFFLSFYPRPVRAYGIYVTYYFLLASSSLFITGENSVPVICSGSARLQPLPVAVPPLPVAVQTLPVLVPPLPVAVPPLPVGVPPLPVAVPPLSSSMLRMLCVCVRCSCLLLHVLRVGWSKIASDYIITRRHFLPLDIIN